MHQKLGEADRGKGVGHIGRVRGCLGDVVLAGGSTVSDKPVVFFK